MVPLTRRRALHAATAVLLPLAGCSGTSSETTAAAGPDPSDNVLRDPDAVAIRTGRDEPPVRLPPSDGDRDPSPGRPWIGSGTRELIAARGAAERIQFVGDDVAAARRFVDGTSFDRETLLLDGHRVPECFTLDLCHVSWSRTEYHTYYARQYRDVDVSCRTDAHDGLTYLIRIPAVLDPAAVRSSGSGTTSGTCTGWERRLEARRGESGRDMGRGGEGAAR